MRIQLKAVLFIGALAGTLLSTEAPAVPWCHFGKIAVVSNQSWNAGTILNHFAQGTPSYTPPATCVGVPASDLDRCKAHVAISHFAKTRSGGSPGKLCQASIPDLMTTRAIATAPQPFLIGGAYNVGMGITFKVEKCFCNSVEAAQPLPKSLSR